jgi:DNA-binding transcriptional MerR regulator
MANDSYDLLELCDAADVTPRTVRYYVQQGLLPAPDTRGRGARYDRAHLERIQLIKRLQGRHLPLAEIRTQLAELSDAAVSALVAEPAAGEKSGSALDYVRNVLSGKKTGSENESRKRELDSPYTVPVPPAEMPIPKFRAREIVASAPAAAPARVSPAVPPAPSAAPPETSTQSRSVWDRIPLAPDIELHIRRPLSRVQNKLLERLLEHARSLFSDPS